MTGNNKPKQPKKPTEENKKFKEKLECLKGIEFENLQEFIKTLDKID
jgi:hypothetical protein